MFSCNQYSGDSGIDIVIMIMTLRFILQPSTLYHARVSAVTQNTFH